MRTDTLIWHLGGLSFVLLKVKPTAPPRARPLFVIKAALALRRCGPVLGNLHFQAEFAHRLGGQQID